MTVAFHKIIINISCLHTLEIYIYNEGTTEHELMSHDVAAKLCRKIGAQHESSDNTIQKYLK